MVLHIAVVRAGSQEVLAHIVHRALTHSDLSTTLVLLLQTGAIEAGFRTIHPRTFLVFIRFGTSDPAIIQPAPSSEDVPEDREGKVPDMFGSVADQVCGANAGLAALRDAADLAILSSQASQEGPMKHV